MRSISMNKQRIGIFLCALVSMCGFAADPFETALQRLDEFNKTGNPSFFEQAIAVIETSTHQTINEALEARFAMIGTLVPYFDKEYENRPHHAFANASHFANAENDVMSDAEEKKGKAITFISIKQVLQPDNYIRIQEDLRSFFKATISLSLLDEAPSINKVIVRAQAHKLPPEIISILVADCLFQFAVEGLDDNSSLSSNVVYYAVSRPLFDFIPFCDFKENKGPSYNDIARVVNAVRRNVRKDDNSAEELTQMMKRLQNIRMPSDILKRAAYFRDKAVIYSLSLVLFVQSDPIIKDRLRRQFRSLVAEIDETFNQLFQQNFNTDCSPEEELFMIEETIAVLIESKCRFEPLLFPNDKTSSELHHVFRKKGGIGSSQR